MRRSWSGQLIAATAVAGVVASGCGVEYRPGDGHGAKDTTAVAAARVDTVVRVDTVWMRTDSLYGTGDPVVPNDSTAAPNATPVPNAPAAPLDTNETAALRARRLAVPVQGVAASALHDTFAESRAAGRPHEALDIMAARGTPVLAADDGTIAKLFTSAAGGLTIYERSGDGRFMLYYAHLDRYRDGLAERAVVKKGDVLGYVGSTGDASPNAPHLHFAIARVATPTQWWGGAPIDPYPLLHDGVERP